MEKYRKKPIEVEAIQWKGDNLAAVIRGIGLHESTLKWTWEQYISVVAREGLKIFTREGHLMADINDWIIRGYSEEFGYHCWPCKPDYFEKAYEPTGETESRIQELEKENQKLREALIKIDDEITIGDHSYNLIIKIDKIAKQVLGGQDGSE